MKISHVIRGEDHLTNTARHVLLQRALGHETPQYAHLPLLLDEKRRKLSKREGAADLLQLRERGYLPAAVLNYLALMGWNPKNDQEYFTHEQLLQNFSLAGVQKGGAIFTEAKLLSINKRYLRQLSPSQLLAAARPFLEKAGIEAAPDNYWEAALRTEQERVETLVALPEAVQFFKPNWVGDYPAARLIWRQSDKETTLVRLKQMADFLAAVPAADFTEEKLQEKILAAIDEHSWGRGESLWPWRVALTGRDKSPGPFAIAAVLGKKMTLARLAAALGRLQ